MTKKSVVVLDYGSGNLRSAQRALERVGASVEVTADAGRPVLGVCVGMQILFARGVEFSVETEGCGQWPGYVTRLQAPVIPHMGWNVVDSGPGSVLFKGLGADTRFYFVHSYAAQQWEGSPDAVLTWATHEGPFLAAVEEGPLSATQFHPEKSGDAGAAVLSNWVQAL